MRTEELARYRTTTAIAVGFSFVTGGAIGAILTTTYYGPFFCTLMMKCASVSPPALAITATTFIGGSLGGLVGTIFTPPFINFMERYCGQPDEAEDIEAADVPEEPLESIILR